MRAEPARAFNRTMLQSTRRGVFRHSYDIAEEGRPVATLTGARREGYTFELDGESFQVTRKGYKGFSFTGSQAGEVARADRAGGRTWTIHSMYGPLELVRTSIWKETWELRRFGQPAGTLSRDGTFKRTSTADLPEDLPLALRLFILCVVEALWERSRQAASGG
jgi:hypothetical protein